MKKIKIVLLSLILIVLITPAITAQEQSGKIVAVNDNHPSILFETNDEIEEYSLALNNSIKLNGREVSINALRPIKDNVFQEAIIKTNQAGEIIKIKSFYQAVAISIEELNESEIVMNDLNNNQLLKYNINQDLTIKKNNQSANLEDLKQGEHGFLILGIEARARKIVLNNYARAN